MRKWLLGLAFLLVFLTACTGSGEIKVTFIENGGSEVDDMTIKTSDQSINFPTPTRESYTFDGWFTDEALTIPFSLSVLLSQQTSITLYAKWTPIINEVSITYVTNGGSSIAPSIYESGVLSVAPVVPTKTGHTFDGWYQEEALTNSYTFGVAVESNMTLYAKWAVNQYTIAFIENGGSDVFDITADFDTSIAAPASPTKLGHTFVGWFSDEALTTPYVFSKMGSANMTLYAKWQINAFDIVFNTNGGNTIDTISLDYQASILLPPNPFKLGHTFDGWFMDASFNTAFSLTSMPNEDITLYAKWLVNAYTISFDAQGGSETSSITQPYDSTIVSPLAPTKAGYDFAGWFVNLTDLTPFVFTTMGSSDITLYAKWTASPYVITFNENGGSDVLDIAANFGDTILEPLDPTKLGHTFAGWFSDETLLEAYTFTTMPVGGKTLYAKWETNTYTISYVIEGSLVTDDFLYNETIQLKDGPLMTGYTFTGWFRDALPFTLTLMPAENITLMPHYQVNQYLIQFGNIEKANMTLDFNARIDITVPFKMGYFFNGWYLDDLLLVPLDTTHMPASDLMLYAKFEKNIYNLYLDKGEGQIEVIDLTYGESYQLDIPLKTGFVFLGWFLEPEFYNKVDTFTMYDSHTTLYAKWAIDEGFMPIESVINTEPSNVSVRGMITYIFGNPGFPGFYLYDGTANIFVLANPSPYQVGDSVSFDATFSKFEETPQLENITNLTLETTTFTMPDFSSYNLEDIPYLDEHHVLNYGQRVLLEGIVSQTMMGYMLQAPFGDNMVALNFRSFVDQTVLLPYLGKLVTLEAYIHDYNGIDLIWHVAVVTTSLTEVVLTDQEKIDQIILLGQTNLNNQIFYPTSKLMLPTNEPAFGASLFFETTGENAMYFDVTSGTFLDTDIDRIITLNCTITINGLSETVTFTFTLKADRILTYQEFLDLPMNGYAKIKGIVVESISMMQITILYVDGNYLIVNNSQPVQIGDEAIFVGYKFEDEVLMLANDPNVSLVEILSSNHPLPFVPTSIDIETYSTLPGDQALYWFRSFMISGTLSKDEMIDMYYITSNGFNLPILVMDYQAQSSLEMYLGMTIEMVGFSIPNFDLGGNLHFAYMNHPNDIKPIGLTDEATLDLIYSKLQQYHSNHSYAIGDLLYLPDIDPVFVASIQYDHYLDSNTYIDLAQKNVFFVEGYQTTIISVTITYNGLSSSYQLTINLGEESPVMTIDAFLDLDQVTLATLEVTVLFPNEGLVVVFDQTGTLMVETFRTDLHPGDKLLVEGYKVDPFMKILSNPGSETVLEVISIGNPLLLPTPMTLAEFNALDMSDIRNQLLFVRIEGIMQTETSTGREYLDNGTDVAYLFAPFDKSILATYLNQQVSIAGLTNPSEDGVTLIFFSHSDGIIAELNKAQVVDDAFMSIQQANAKVYYDGQGIYLPATYAPYPITITYLPTLNGHLVDVENQKIIDTLAAPAIIELEVTITFLDYSHTYLLILSVEPLVIKSISDILAGPNDVTVAFEGVVIYTSTDHNIYFIIVRDSTCQILVEGKYQVQIGDLVRVIGVTTYQEGLLTISDFMIEVETLMLNSAIPVAEDMSFASAYFLNTALIENQYRYISVTGYVWYNGENFYLTTDIDGGYEMPIIQTYESYNLFDYESTKVTISGFLLYEPNYEMNGLLFSGHSAHITSAYLSDAERMADLITLGRKHYEYQTYHPFETIDMPATFDALGATLSYQITNNASYMDLNHQIIQVTEPISITLEVTITIGALTEVVSYIIHVEPYINQPIDGLMYLDDHTFVMITGTVLAAGDYYYVIQDETGMVYIEGFGGLHVGDIASVYGHVNKVSSTVYLNGFTTMSKVEVIGTETAMPVETPSSIYDLYFIDIMSTNPVFYTTLTGLILEEDGIYYITDGLYKIEITTSSEAGLDTLFANVGNHVNLKAYFLGIDTYMGRQPLVLFTNLLGEISPVTLSDEYIRQEMLLYAVHMLEEIFRPGATYPYPTTHPYFGGSYQIINNGIDAAILNFNQGLMTVAEVSTYYNIHVQVEATYNGITISQDTIIYVEPYDIYTIAGATSSQMYYPATFSGIIIAMDYHYDTFIYIYDGTGVFTIIDMTNNLHNYLGHEIIITAILELGFGGNIFFAFDYYIEEIGEKTYIDPSMFVHYGFILNEAKFNMDTLYGIYEIDGTVLVDGDQVYLINGTDQMVLVGNLSLTYQTLLSQNGLLVTVEGVILGTEGVNPDGSPRVIMALIDRVV